jgi:hypothetical protein
MADDDYEPDEPQEEPQDEPPEEPQEEPKPRPKVSTFTIVLIFLNWIAAGAFLYLLFLDYKVRQDWSYAIVLNYLDIWGLPLTDEEPNSAYQVARPRLRLDAEQLKEAFATAGRGGKGGGTFGAVDAPVPFTVTPGMMTEQVKNDHFKGLNPAVNTLNDEVDRLKKLVPGEIKKAAQEAATKLGNDDAKRQAIAQILLPLSWDIHQVEKLNDQVAKATGAALDKLVNEAFERRMYADLLAPMNIFRPGDVEKYTVEKAADVANLKLEDLHALLLQRFDGAIAAKYDPEIHYGKLWEGAANRDSVEKRQQIGFLLFTLSQLRGPNGEPLVAKGLERAQAVCGLHELAMAAQNYAHTLGVLEERVLKAIRQDREGIVATMKDGKITQSASFIDRQNAEVVRLKEVVTHIQHSDERIKDLKEQRARFETVLAERQKHLKTITDKLVDARKDTADTLQEVRKLQRDLYEAQKTLADAARRNFELEAEIRQSEARLKRSR